MAPGKVKAASKASQRPRKSKSVVRCKECKKEGKLKLGKTCGACGKSWHEAADCTPTRQVEPDAGDVGDWVGGWRCQACLDRWETRLKVRTARVVEAWAAHEERRERKAEAFEAARRSAMSAAVKDKRHGFEVAKVKVPPIRHPPAGILPFMDVQSIKDTGFRLARFSRDDCAFMGPEGVMAKVDLCWEHRIFAVIEGVFDTQKQPLVEFLEERKSLSCRISGKEATAKCSSTLGDYRAQLSDFEGNKFRTNSPGTFFLDTPRGQTEVLSWLPTDPLMSCLLPESPRGGLKNHMVFADKCKFGPFTFGGGRNTPLKSSNMPVRQTLRQLANGKSRDRIGGSTTHIDGMGSFAAVGGLKAGVKKVTAFETADCAAALAVTRFKSFGRPGGSNYLVNQRLDDDPSLRRRLSEAGVRFSTFLINAGDAYFVPSGTLHEFLNQVPCLSVAWNIMPHPANCGVALELAERTAMEAREALGANTDRAKSTIEHAPPEALRKRLAGFKVRRWLQKGILRRRALAAVDGDGAAVRGMCDISTDEAAARWATMEIPLGLRKRNICLWPNGAFYKEARPVSEVPRKEKPASSSPPLLKPSSAPVPSPSSRSRSRSRSRSAFDRSRRVDNAERDRRHSCSAQRSDSAERDRCGSLSGKPLCLPPKNRRVEEDGPRHKQRSSLPWREASVGRRDRLSGLDEGRNSRRLKGERDLGHGILSRSREMGTRTREPMDSVRGGMPRGGNGCRGASDSGQRNGQGGDIDRDVPRPFFSRAGLPDRSMCSPHFAPTSLPPVAPPLISSVYGTVSWNLGKVNGRGNWSGGVVGEGVKVGTEKSRLVVKDGMSGKQSSSTVDSMGSSGRESPCDGGSSAPVAYHGSGDAISKGIRKRRRRAKWDA